jgi:hypothetical protein
MVLPKSDFDGDGKADIGVRKVVLQSAATFKSPTIVAKLRQIAETEQEPILREFAANAVKKAEK